MPRTELPIPDCSDFDELDDLTLLACLVFGEARGESYQGKLATAWTVRNRVEAGQPKWFGEGYRGVILRPYQFSAFLKSDPNRSKMLAPMSTGGPMVWRMCFKAACAAYFGFEPDVSGGSDHYHVAGIKPPWADQSKITATIGNHVFYKLRA